jgi:uncharacterized protein YfaS (alpha-2-macroglobulin family)
MNVVRKISRVYVWLSVIIFGVLLASCNNDGPKIDKKKIKTNQTYVEKVNQEYVKYVSEYTSGLVTRNTDIKFVLNKMVSDTYKVGETLPSGIVEISPKVEGELILQGKYMVVFRPKELLKSETVYTGNLNLKKLLGASGEFSKFPFRIYTIQLNSNLTVKQYQPYENSDLTKNYIEANINSSDYIPNDEITKYITAEQINRPLPIKVIRKSTYDVTVIVDSVIRKKNTSFVIINAEDEKLGLEEDVYRVELRGIDEELTVINYRKGFIPSRYIELVFSSPLSTKQDIKDFIVLKSTDEKVEYSYKIDGNVLTLYPNKYKTDYRLTLYKGLKSVNKKILENNVTRDILFEQIMPSITLIGKGNIMPDTENLIFPFKAKGLKSVNVTIVKVFSDNIGHFFQDENISSTGRSSLRKVGQPIYNGTLPLKAKNYSEYKTTNNYYLDLSKLIDVEKGTIYNVILDFSMTNLAFPCSKEDNDVLATNEVDEDYWDGGSGRYIDYNYDYSERNNPCHDYYYHYHTTRSTRNLMSSNFGIITKRNEDGVYNVIITDLKTTNPIKDVKVELYSYQNQKITGIKTDKDGIASFEIKKKALFLKATKGKDVGYLKIRNSEALSYSMFDISGTKNKKGQKAFLYGERGVWRPGDSLHFFLVLEDKLKNLPSKYPTTFRLYSPDNQLVSKTVVKESVNGFYRFSTVTTADAPTGNWSLYADVGGETYSKEVKIEMVKPNRLKVKLESNTKFLELYKRNKLKLSSQWLTGANAGNLDATVSVKLIPQITSFEGYRNFDFNDESLNFRSNNSDIFEGELDLKGNIEISYKPVVDGDVPGVLKARFTSNVFEKGGDYSFNVQDYNMYSYKRYVGFNVKLDDERYNMLYTGRNHKINIVTIDTKGKKLSSKVTVKLYRLRWSWWWSSSNESWASYVNDDDYLKVTSKEITTKDGLGSFEFNIPDSDWGRYYILVEDKVSGHTAGKKLYIDWPNWNSRGNAGSDAANMLVFDTDKEKYSVGEEITLSLPTASKGRALVSIEKGGDVLKMFWVETNKGLTKVKFKATSDMAPNIFANITYIQKHSQTVNDLPIRMYGVTNINVEDPKTHLEPTLKTPKSIESETDYTVEVGEKSGRAMTYSLAIVDEGLLDLTNYKTPDLWKYFYKREALRTNTWDMYDFVIGAYGSRLQKMLAVGGDSNNKNSEDKTANRFVPVVKVLGPFNLQTGKTDKHHLKMTNYIGSVRIMVVAGDNGAYGKIEKAVPVKKPVMVLATLPRELKINETCELPVTIFAMENSIKTVKVKVETNNKVSLLGSSSTTVKFNKKGEKMAYFKLRTKDLTGVAKVKVMVQSGRNKAYQEIELNIKNPNPPLTITKQYVLDAKGLKFDIVPVGIKGTNSMTIEVSSLPSMNIESRLDYLIRYPHGCIEQTTSSVFPQLHLSDVTNLSESRKVEIEKNIKAGIKRLYKFQLSDGGMSYWIGGNYANEWGTSYAGNFLFDAEKMGYSLPYSFKKKWIEYQNKRANGWTATTSNKMVQAYRLYTLSLSGNANIGAMNRLKALELRSEEREMLALAYVASGHKSVAKQMLAEDVDYIKADNNYYYYSYGSKYRDLAVRLMAYSSVEDVEKAGKVIVKVADALSSDRYMSTQTTAYSLLAVSKYISMFNAGKSINITSSINGKKQNIKARNTIYTIYIDDADKNQKIEIANSRKGKLHVRVTNIGIPAEKQEIEYADNLKLNIVYSNRNGKVLDVSELKQGTEFVAKVTVKNTDNISSVRDIALSQIFPSGWEIVNNRLLGTVNKNMDQPDYIDIRDDRVYQYFDLKPSETKVFEVSLISSYVGEYYLPGVTIGAMYDDSYKAAIKGKEVKVVRD